MKRIVILGATGSIGTSAVDVVRTHPHDFRVVALSAFSSREKVDSLALEFGARAYVGEDAAVRAVEESEADICLVATVGLSGLKPTLAAIEKGMDIALATKEVLVMAGELVMARATARASSGVSSAGASSFPLPVARTVPRMISPRRTMFGRARPWAERW